MRFIFLSLTLLFLIQFIQSDTQCSIKSTNGQNISGYNDCKSISTSSENNLCCYVSGFDNKENKISACNEFSGTEKGAAKDLYDLESYFKDYYLQVDCNFTNKISLCDPDDMKSDTPLSYDICKKNYNVGIFGIDDDMKCCYLTAKNVQNKDVYSCVGIDDYFNTISDMKNKLESGDYKRIGALKDVEIICKSNSKSNSDDSSNSSFLSQSLFIFLILMLI